MTALSASLSAPPRVSVPSVAFALAKREFTRFVRQPARLAGSIGQPLLFWLVLGSGLSPSFRPTGMAAMSYTEYFYPGMLLMMVLFASVFSTITVIEDRDQGFLQGVLVAPVSRLAIVLGKVGGAAAIALFQSIVLLCAAPVLGFSTGPLGYLLILVTLTLLSLGFTGLGFLTAWGMASTSGFHAVMMLVLMPLWFLSGALFPVQGVPAVLEGLMMINPVTHGMTILRAPFYEAPGALLSDGSYLGSLAVVALWVVLALGASAWRVGRRERGAPTP
ncbi:multidrug ABC transporter permease [Rhodospirillum rubrum]|uniref:ABC transporter permease n=1 Tax=Rhodospirillum rubrum TaxID=1085 RepID=UPI001904B694|nr:ABC transporter permease [Rhodospirillum rubrum]MBK1664391.1 multidrug ABC transporter permease [Rhodospirillum rubrum]MBK1677633.1 multidrug ABC transporter permease [Rhodospirillum rubrum]